MDLTPQYSAANILKAYDEQMQHNRDVDKYRRWIYAAKSLADPSYARSAKGAQIRAKFGTSSKGTTGMISRMKMLRDEEQDWIKGQFEKRQIEAMPGWETDEDFSSWLTGQGEYIDRDKAMSLWNAEKNQRRASRAEKRQIAQEGRSEREEERAITKLDKSDLVAIKSFELVNEFVTDYSVDPTYKGERNAERAIRARVTNDDSIPKALKPKVIAEAVKRLKAQFGTVGRYDAAKERDRVKEAQNAVRAAEQKNRDHETKVTKEALESARRGNTEVMASGIYSRVRGGMTKEAAMAEVVQANGIAQYNPTLLAQMLEVGLPPAPTTKKVLNLETGESEWATNREIADNNRLVPAHSKGETMALRMQAAAWVLMQEEGGMTPEILKYYMANGFDNWREEDEDILRAWFLKYASRDSALENLVKIIGAREEKRGLVIEDVTE